jgi:glycosyltransferase involved in cell wall biosynthesis
MQSPVFSVVVPTHNRAHLVGRAIQSVLNQTFTDFELIVVDDASRDNTGGVVAAIADHRLSYVRLDKNLGVAGARNRGVLQARGQFVIFLDDDDESYPDLLAATFHAFESAGETVGFGWSGIRRVQDTPEGELILDERQWPDNVRESQPWIYLLVGTGFGLTIRRSCFDGVGFFDESLSSFEDTDLLIRLENRFDFLVVPGIHIKVHSHAGEQLTDITAKRVLSLEHVVRKNGEILQKKTPSWIRANYSVARSYYRLGQKDKGRLTFLRMLRQKPLQLLVWKQFLHLELFGPQPTEYGATHNKQPLLER